MLCHLTDFSGVHRKDLCAMNPLGMLNLRLLMQGPLLLLGALSLPTAGMLVPYGSFLVPPGLVSSTGGTVAKDAIGNDVVASEWLKVHGLGDRTLTQGLKGDPTYLVVEKDRTLATFAINAVCTHLGCVVPFNHAENKFICPCHRSQYNDQGRVVRGSAPLSLALAHYDIGVDDGKVVFVPWVETDFQWLEQL
ncbi:cytochrome b6-f complex iron-sulfur subunit, chloroplastic-like [Vicia villosa]|uniref:cytochrome b6-f complex iron-sulfur subunit, chloroplastic-like n=1 Tax=Vicia villosa TaxID=3911 RepID=UPI00273CEEB0|nr:cytochrome b6-f complex iron-sulfur subunit, chloroplastic-like [Vicia villosa]XP_058727610.1 cytochrome b6-f complex iron-sulfur subunit, chloroplastic-like [Vicia villosa]XP_058727611.1 cytochrome b6-f complex iron-sulfur subunit, chloroplastic-like [Vicia villosa]XP_058727612.1 cytochrome b6-f complex iron-sulfur subunit, chloroplastic-like [Vicia villosa]XP_058727613.1 cytochrome b6-f complex iron-sulfur subunit, chloroplastic-like [Vicia villosa]XP_058727614.1 cytochrome b6-f complex i